MVWSGSGNGVSNKKGISNALFTSRRELARWTVVTEYGLDWITRSASNASRMIDKLSDILNDTEIASSEIL